MTMTAICVCGDRSIGSRSSTGTTSSSQSSRHLNYLVCSSSRSSSSSGSGSGSGSSSSSSSRSSDGTWKHLSETTNPSFVLLSFVHVLLEWAFLCVIWLPSSSSSSSVVAAWVPPSPPSTSTSSSSPPRDPFFHRSSTMMNGHQEANSLAYFDPPPNIRNLRNRWWIPNHTNQRRQVTVSRALCSNEESPSFPPYCDPSTTATPPPGILNTTTTTTTTNTNTNHTNEKEEEEESLPEAETLPEEDSSTWTILFEECTPEFFETHRQATTTTTTTTSPTTRIADLPPPDDTPPAYCLVPPPPSGHRESSSTDDDVEDAAASFIISLQTMRRSWNRQLDQFYKDNGYGGRMPHMKPNHKKMNMNMNMDRQYGLWRMMPLPPPPSSSSSNIYDENLDDGITDIDDISTTSGSTSGSGSSIQHIHQQPIHHQPTPALQRQQPMLLVATIRVSRRQDGYFLRGLCVAKEYRQEGLALRLLTDTIDQIHSGHISTTTNTTNTATATTTTTATSIDNRMRCCYLFCEESMGPLYERAGFELQSSKRGCVDDDNGDDDNGNGNGNMKEVSGNGDYYHKSEAVLPNSIRLHYESVRRRKEEQGKRKGRCVLDNSSPPSPPSSSSSSSMALYIRIL